MGSPLDEPERQPNEGPQHHVTLAGFLIGAFPVTQAQWSAVVLAHPNRVRRDLEPSPAFFRGVDLPVEGVTWSQAAEFCLRLSALTSRAYRLASEAEWEDACRAGTTSPFNCGPTITAELANYCGTGGAVCGFSDNRSVASEVYNGVTTAAAFNPTPGSFLSPDSRSNARSRRGW
jgi:formylglycine-generating enzyme required for sulfatase activity